MPQSSRLKHNHNSKRIKTQNSGYSAFDQSIVLLVLNKIQKVLIDISKEKIDNISVAIKFLNKDFNVISQFSKERPKLAILFTHLNSFQMIQTQRYEIALQNVVKKQNNLKQKTNSVLKLSINLLKSLLLKFLKRQEQSRSTILKAITEVDLKQIKVSQKSIDYKIIELTIICITIIAQHFSKFQDKSEDSKNIYREAYYIAKKYLTQYHKLTQILFSIFQKNQNAYEDLKRSTKNYKFKSKKRKFTLSNKQILLQKSSRSYLNSSIEPRYIIKNKDSMDNQVSRHTKNNIYSNKLKNIQISNSLQVQKQRYLNKLYGNPLQQSLKERKYSKGQKHSTLSKRTTYYPQQASQMKELQKISKLYLPKLTENGRKKDSLDSNKLEAIQVIKFGSTLERLKPQYFSRLQKFQNHQFDIDNKKEMIDLKKPQERISTSNKLLIQKMEQKKQKMEKKVPPQNKDSIDVSLSPIKQKKSFKKIQQSLRTQQSSGCQII